MKENIQAISLQTITKEANIPFNVTVELLTKCNLKCNHCYIPERISDGLDDKAIVILLRELREMGALYLNLTGGEIFLRKNILNTIREARIMGFSVNLLSNATLLDEKIIKELSDLNISSFGTTIFSLNSDIHDGITGVKGSLEKIIVNVCLLKKYHIPVEIKTPIMTANQSCFRELEKFCIENNFLFIPSPTISSKTNGDTSVRELRVDDDGMDDAIDMIVRNSPDAVEEMLEQMRNEDTQVIHCHLVLTLPIRHRYIQ